MRFPISCGVVPAGNSGLNDVDLLVDAHDDKTMLNKDKDKNLRSGFITCFGFYLLVRA
jgi:hypothetical protein